MTHSNHRTDRRTQMHSHTGMSPRRLLSMLFIYSIHGSAVCVNGAFPPSLRYTQQQLQLQPANVNQIADVTATCDLHSLNVTVRLQRAFKGVLFAKDFSMECRALGSHSDTVSISLPTSGCGVRLGSEPARPDSTYYYSVTFVAQQDKHLRQISDQEREVRCDVAPAQVFKVRSNKMAEVVKEALAKGGGVRETSEESHRTGRMKEEGWSKDYTTDDSTDDSTSDNVETSASASASEALEDALGAARAWMEIVPVQATPNPGTIQVGEETLLLVKSTLPAGIGWSVIDCSAHDGLGEASQRLLDEFGCALDEQLLPELLKGPTKPIALMRHQEAVARFAAFKFPDRDRLHLTCGLQLCRGPCQKVDCHHTHNNTSAISNMDDTNRLGRHLQRGEQGEVLDRLEVFNSVEVLAPEIELEDLRRSERLQSDYITTTFGRIPGDRTVCVSPDKMAVTLCTLGLVFLAAVIIAACALYRSRADTTNVTSTSTNGSTSSGTSLFPTTLVPHLPLHSYYARSRSLFSSGGSGGEGGGGGGGGGSGYGGGKMLLEESCSSGSGGSGRRYGQYAGSQAQTVRGYGRIL